MCRIYCIEVDNIQVLEVLRKEKECVEIIWQVNVPMRYYEERELTTTRLKSHLLVEKHHGLVSTNVAFQ